MGHEVENGADQVPFGSDGSRHGQVFWPKVVAFRQVLQDPRVPPDLSIKGGTKTEQAVSLAHCTFGSLLLEKAR